MTTIRLSPRCWSLLALFCAALCAACPGPIVGPPDPDPEPVINPVIASLVPGTVPAPQGSGAQYPAVPLGAAWMQAGADQLHSKHVSALGPAAEPAEDWRFNVESETFSAPAFTADGRAYILGASSLTILDPAGKLERIVALDSERADYLADQMLGALPRFDYLAGDLQPQHVGRARRRRIKAPALEDVGTVHSGRGDLHQHFVPSRTGHRPFDDGKLFRPVRLRSNDGLHRRWNRAGHCCPAF